VGTSTESWKKATVAAVDRAGKTLRDLRIAEVVQLDLQSSEGKVQAHRARVKLSLKYEDWFGAIRLNSSWKRAATGPHTN
jgi:dodecin